MVMSRVVSYHILLEHILSVTHVDSYWILILSPGAVHWHGIANRGDFDYRALFYHQHPLTRVGNLEEVR